MSWTRTPCILAALLLAGCSSTPTSPDLPTGRIDGAVVDRVLQPFANLTVHLVNLNWTDTTSQLGGFTFRDVPPGTYTLTAQAAGMARDVQVVEVRPDHVTRVILQLLPLPVETPFVTTLMERAHADVALPGQECGECAWSTYVLERPEEMVVRASWDSLRGEGEMTLQLLSPNGTLAEHTGPSPAEFSVRGLPGAGSYKLAARFAPGFTPQPIDLEWTLDLYYGAPRPR